MHEHENGDAYSFEYPPSLPFIMFEFCDMTVVVSVDLIGGTSASSSNLIVGTFEWTLGSKASNLFWVKL